MSGTARRHLLASALATKPPEDVEETLRLGVGERVRRLGRPLAGGVLVLEPPRSGLAS
jgi:hypothetical protein